jgi:hypothetical protein
MFDQFPTSFLKNPAEAYNLVIGRWYNDFLKSQEFSDIDDGVREYTGTILSDMTGFMLYYQDCEPSAWNMENIQHCLLIDYPRSLFRTEEYLYSVDGVLIHFFNYLEASQLLPGSADIVSMIEEIRVEFWEEMEDPDNYSMRKRILFASEDEDFDINDEKTVIAYFKSVGEQEMEGFDPDFIDALNFVLTTWIVPFSDSRYITSIGTACGKEVTEVISIITGYLIQENINPLQWDVSDIIRVIEEYLIPFPVEQEVRELYIPVAHAFFTFLAEEGLHPHAREIADAILPMHERVISDTEAAKVGRITEIMLQHLFQDRVDIEDEAAVDAYLRSHGFDILIECIASEYPELGEEIVKAGLKDKKSDEPPRIKPINITSIPKDRRDRYLEIIALTDQYCQEQLDEEYARICQNVAARLSRKRDYPLRRGKIALWAAGIVYAVGQMNFLFDSSFEPYQSADDICQFFGTKKSSTSQKAKVIRDIVGMNDYWDPEFSTSRMKEKDPFKTLRVTRNGFIF